MTMPIAKLKTIAALGFGNVARVAAYRLGLRTGLHPCLKISGVAPEAPFFEQPVARPQNDLEARSDWSGGQGRFFGKSVTVTTSADLPPDWFAVPGKNVRAISDQPWWTISDFDPKVGDIKMVWELSRFDWIIPLAQRAALGEAQALARLNKWLQDWAEKNPPYMGANWKCGQEASIRVMHLVLAALILGQVSSPNSGLLGLIRLHLARIAPTIGYAIGQANNHGTSEAAALFIGGSLLSDEQGKGWSEVGRHWLENRARVLIEPDGTFSQYSLTYHRLMLDTYSLAEVWRRQRGLPVFSENCLGQLAAATDWLVQMTDKQSGDGPNMGANDGAQIIALTSSDYRDFRPSVQLGSALFRQCRAYKAGSWDQQLLWLGVDVPEKKCVLPESKTFDQGGLHVLRKGAAVVYLRYPRFRFRPSQADALHCDLWVAGKNILRDAGTYSYNVSEQDTAYFNGTSAHNTIEFDNRDQMPRLGRFLFGDWLKSDQVAVVSENIESITAMAAYKDRWGVFHKRQLMLGENSLRVIDEISGFEFQAVLRWRLAPGNWKLRGQILSNGKTTMKISGSMPLISVSLNEGEESRYYLQKTTLPVLEIKMDKPGVLTTEISF